MLHVNGPVHQLDALCGHKIFLLFSRFLVVTSREHGSCESWLFATVCCDEAVIRKSSLIKEPALNWTTLTGKYTADFGLLVLGFPAVGLRPVRPLPFSGMTWPTCCKAKLFAGAHKNTECYAEEKERIKAEDGGEEEGVQS